MKLRPPSRRLVVGFVAACFGGAGSSARAAQVAASIEFETVARPAGLPDDMQPLPGARLTFLSIKAIDGYKIAAACGNRSKKRQRLRRSWFKFTVAAPTSPSFLCVPWRVPSRRRDTLH